MKYRRAKVKGGTYFFTVVANNRIKILNHAENTQLLRESFKKIMKNHPFRIEAFVLLPDHLHCIWSLPDQDSDFSTRWRLIKSHFSRKCNLVGWGEERNPTKANASRLKKKEKPVWQRRFWEHLIRNNDDLKQHIDYIHYNPVKHNLVKAPKDWQYSSFHRYVATGIYNLEWGAGVSLQINSNVGYE